MRARVDGQVVEVDAEPPKLAKTKVHDIEAVVDRLVVREGIRPRIAESVDLALKLGEGTVILSIQEGDAWDDRISSIHYACPSCGTSLGEVEPRTFSLQQPPRGLPEPAAAWVRSREFDPDLVVPDRSQVARRRGGRRLGGPAGRGPAVGRRTTRRWVRSCKRHQLDRSTPLADWPAKALGSFFQGEPEGYPGRPGRPGAGLCRREDRCPAGRRSTRSGRKSTCPDCRGARLRPEARAVTRRRPGDPRAGRPDGRRRPVVPGLAPVRAAARPDRPAAGGGGRRPAGVPRPGRAWVT